MREEWHIAVRNIQVRIEYNGAHYYTSSQFERKESAEGLVALFRIGVLEYGHPFADDRNPAPPIVPRPDPAGATKKR